MDFFLSDGYYPQDGVDGPIHIAAEVHTILHQECTFLINQMMSIELLVGVIAR
ncbi:MAG: hypothetical protein ACTSRA_04960 [Promethearchaeota archaeon]